MHACVEHTNILQIKLFSLLHVACIVLKHIFLYKNHIVPTKPVFGSLPFSKPDLQVFFARWHEYEFTKPLITKNTIVVRG